MKLFKAGVFMASLGFYATISLGQEYRSRYDTPSSRQNIISYGDSLPGSRYHSVRSAYRYRFQEPVVGEEAVEEVPLPANNVDSIPGHAVPDNRVPSTKKDPAPITIQPEKAAPSDDASSWYDSPSSNPDSVGSSCYDGSCDIGEDYFCETGCCEAGPCCGWFGGVYGLIMARENDYGYTLSYDSTNPTSCLIHSHYGQDDYQGGVDARIGKYFCGCYGLELAYWGIYPDVDQFRSDYTALGGGDLYTAIGYDGLLYNNGTIIAPVQQFYGNATQTAQFHRYRRSYEVHNVEVNLIRNPFRRTSCGCFHYELLAGFRYFRFNDGFQFSSDYVNNTFGDDINNELHHDIEVDNDLYGFQLGGRADYYIHRCWSVNVSTKFGIYNNDVGHFQQIRGGNGFAYDTTSGNDYFINSSDDDIAFLGELSVGASYDIGCHWRLTGGYRVFSACGVATANDQMPRDYAFPVQSQEIKSDECLVLHGGYFGVEYNW